MYFCVHNVQCENNVKKKENFYKIFQLNKGLSSWDEIFEKSVELIKEDRKAMNFIKKKTSKLQSQV